jgi:hypothetical protein
LEQTSRPFGFGRSFLSNHQTTEAIAMMGFIFMRDYFLPIYILIWVVWVIDRFGLMSTVKRALLGQKAQSSE